MKQYESIINAELADQIETALMGGLVRWQFACSTVSNEFRPHYIFTSQLLDSHQLVSSVVADGIVVEPVVFDLVKPIFDNLLVREGLTDVDIERIKINTLLKDDDFVDGMFNVPHTDNPDSNFKTFIYYVNNSSGNTYFFNNYSTDTLGVELVLADSVTPKKGAGVLFPSSQFHASSNPTTNLRRLVINFVFKTHI